MVPISTAKGRVSSEKEGSLSSVSQTSSRAGMSAPVSFPSRRSISMKSTKKTRKQQMRNIANMASRKRSEK